MYKNKLDESCLEIWKKIYEISENIGKQWMFGVLWENRFVRSIQQSWAFFPVRWATFC